MDDSYSTHSSLSDDATRKLNRQGKLEVAGVTEFKAGDTFLGQPHHSLAVVREAEGIICLVRLTLCDCSNSPDCASSPSSP